MTSAPSITHVSSMLNTSPSLPPIDSSILSPREIVTNFIGISQLNQDPSFPSPAPLPLGQTFDIANGPVDQYLAANATNTDAVSWGFFGIRDTLGTFFQGENDTFSPLCGERCKYTLEVITNPRESVDGFLNYTTTNGPKLYNAITETLSAFVAEDSTLYSLATVGKSILVNSTIYGSAMLGGSIAVNSTVTLLQNNANKHREKEIGKIVYGVRQAPLSRNEKVKEVGKIAVGVGLVALSVVYGATTESERFLVTTTALGAGLANAIYRATTATSLITVKLIVKRKAKSGEQNKKPVAQPTAPIAKPKENIDAANTVQQKQIPAACSVQ